MSARQKQRSLCLVHSCVPSANFVETLEMTNLRTQKMLIALLAGKSPWIKLTRRENHCMLCKFKQAWCTLWLNSSNLSSENYNFKAQTWIQTKRQRKESIKSENAKRISWGNENWPKEAGCWSLADGEANFNFPGCQVLKLPSTAACLHRDGKL